MGIGCQEVGVDMPQEVDIDQDLLPQHREEGKLLLQQVHCLGEEHLVMGSGAALVQRLEMMMLEDGLQEQGMEHHCWEQEMVQASSLHQLS